MKTKKSVTFSLSDNMIKAVDLFAEQVHLSKSVIVNLALCKYLESKDEFRNNPKAKELLKDTDFFTTIEK
jgi:predicted transcriptional regulator